MTNSESFSHSMRSKSPSTYESKRVGLTSFSMPAPNTNANLKQRLHSLEDAFDLQVQSNNAVDGQLSSLHSYVSALDSRVTDDMSDLKNKLEDDLAWMQKEFNHRCVDASPLVQCASSMYLQCDVAVVDSICSLRRTTGSSSQ